MLLTPQVYFVIFSSLSLLYSFDCNETNEATITEKAHFDVTEQDSIKSRVDYSKWTSNVKVEEAPWMVGIVIYGRIWCAGTLIRMTVALTAAHCFSYLLHAHDTNEILEDVRACVECESLDEYDFEDLHRVVKILINPKFTGNAPPYTDLAFVVIQNTGGLKQSTYQPIGIDHPSAIEKLALPQSFIEITAWGGDKGTSEDFAAKATSLRRTRLKVRKVVDCEKAFAHVNGFIYDSEKYFCATFQQGKRDACVYDAGAPAVQNGVMVGMFLFGPHICGQGTPAIFIKFSVLSDFMDGFIKLARRNLDTHTNVDEDIM